MLCAFLFISVYLRLLKHNYDTVAWFYDSVARLIFGKAQINAQAYLLAAIPAGAKVFIIGGGSGRVLEDMAKLHPCGLNITFVDASERMIAKAKLRNAGRNQVMYISAAVEQLEFANWGIEFGYDIILTPFLFDNLTQATAIDICQRMDEVLMPGGKWLYCDFENTGKTWQKLLLRTMYTFFRLCCGIKAKRLPEISSFFFSHKYKIIAQKSFYKRFIVAEIYEKN